METVQKSARSNPDSMSSIEAVWQEIFVRLPVETLCRFRSVCKSWNSFISSAFFTNLRYSFTQHNPAPVHNLRQDVHFPFQFHCDLGKEDSYYEIAIVDVVHGLVCVSYSLDSCFDSTIIWNPAIHRYSTLPRFSIPSHIDSAVEPEFGDEVRVLSRFFSNAIGFGFDPSTNDYKVVRLWMCWDYLNTYPGLFPATYEVYSTRQGLLRTVLADNLKSDEITFHVGCQTIGCFVNGTINWIVMSNDDQDQFKCLMFDIESEEFKIVDFPQELYQPNINWTDSRLSPVSWTELLEYGGMLSAFMERKWEARIELWVMKEHGLASTWNKLYSICLSCDVMDLYRPSFLKLAPGGPNQRIRFRRHVHWFVQVYGYEESMFFVEGSEAKSSTYLNDEVVDIFIPTDNFVNF